MGDWRRSLVRALRVLKWWDSSRQARRASNSLTGGSDVTRTSISVWGLFLAVSIARTAPQTKTDGPPAYLPTAVGATAVYQTTAGKLSMETTDKVTGVEKTRDGFRVTVERTSKSGPPKKSGFPAATEETDVSAQGVTLVRRAGREVDPPMLLLKLPAKAGDQWEWEAKKADGLPKKVTFKLAGEEEVEVPAGKFKAIRVEQEEVE